MTEYHEINGVIFEWNGNKAAANIEKHGVSFPETASVFFDDGGLILPDRKHSDEEERIILIGFSERRVLTVAHTERRVGYRIINARKATRREREEYERKNAGRFGRR